ncbi:MAG: glycosyltransferase involved in cell wall biosynthesis [Glaciecola sp.]|jgi:glycosyltransferase involved in cell wall biosynthesis
MKVLLIGEYSRLHNSLKEGLLQLGHEVVLLGTGDGFKNYPSDIPIKLSVFSNPTLKIIAKAFDKLFNIQLIELEYYYKLKKIVSSLKGFDVVQLINEQSLKTSPKHEIKLISKLISQNKYLFLLSSGTDYISVKYALDEGFKYSILTPYLEDSSLKKQYRFILKYVSYPYKKLHEFLFENIQGVIASDLDYHIPLKGHSKYLGLIPNPVNTDKIQFKPLTISDKIIIFHGINRMNYIKKGNVFFQAAIEIIKEKYNEKIEIIVVENLPYNDYIKAFDRCHILLDQVYAYDQGYNALEAMAKGKVVFTGAEQEWLNHYNLQEDTVAINALPNTVHIASKLEWLINNPDKLIEISKNARAFIEKEHQYKNIANRYLKIWMQ